MKEHDMDLFAPYRLGQLALPNRIVMAPMTRSRAIGGVPNTLMADYYTRRATAGLIVTEGTAPSPNGLGYARIPGLYSEAQIAGWRQVTDQVHAAGGRIVAQLMHTGRIAHAHNLPLGARALAPSAVTAGGTMWTDEAGPQPHAAPEAMRADDIVQARGEFVHAAKSAIAAGFDGIELHGANGYLLEQFLNPHSNLRTDAYGGDVERRARFVLEVASATAEAIGPDRVGIRLSPHNTYNDLGLYEETRAQYEVLARGLRGLMYVHLVATPHPDAAATRAAIRTIFGGPVIANGGYDRARGDAAIQSGEADLVSYARHFIANPDLVARLRTDAPLAAANPATFFSPGPEGYTDFASA